MQSCNRIHKLETPMQQMETSIFFFIITISKLSALDYLYEGIADCRACRNRDMLDKQVLKVRLLLMRRHSTCNTHAIHVSLLLWVYLLSFVVFICRAFSNGEVFSKWFPRLMELQCYCSSCLPYIQYLLSRSLEYLIKCDASVYFKINVMLVYIASTPHFKQNIFHFLKSSVCLNVQ